tara:strand:+ start:482 stop:682 length:201 start_codon:yes stop_codon:yes gene_type:complete
MKDNKKKLLLISIKNWYKVDIITGIAILAFGIYTLSTVYQVIGATVLAVGIINPVGRIYRKKIGNI